MPPEPLPRSPEAVLLSAVARVIKIMPRVGVGVALGTWVGHVVTYRGSPEVPNLHRFHQKESKTVKKGYPLFLTRFREDFGYLPRECVGVLWGTVGACGHHRGSPEGYLIYTAFAKKCQK